MAEKCKYPGCHRKAKNTWALVPLCNRHYEDVSTETQHYYNGKGELKASYIKREHYQAIARFTPWGKKVKK